MLCLSFDANYSGEIMYSGFTRLVTHIKIATYKSNSQFYIDLISGHWKEAFEPFHSNYEYALQSQTWLKKKKERIA